MLKLLWNRTDRFDLKVEAKYRIFRVALELPAGLIGLLLWFLLRSLCFDGWDWMLCFIGYPILVTWIAAVFYCCRHEFHNGRGLGL